MKVLGALLIGVLLLPALAFGQAFNFPDAPTLNKQVGGPGVQIYKWDGTKWLTVPSGASLAGPYPDGSTWSATDLNSPTFTGTVTMPDASTITSTGYNTVKGIGIGTTVGGNN